MAKFHISAGQNFETTTPSEMHDIVKQHFDAKKLVDDYLREKVRGVKPIFFKRTIQGRSSALIDAELNMSPNPGYIWSILYLSGYPYNSGQQYENIWTLNGLGLGYNTEPTCLTFSKGQILMTDADILDVFIDFTTGTDMTTTVAGLLLEIPAERVGELYV